MSNLNFLFKPQQVAIIGASKSPQKIGYAILENVLKSNYSGKIYPVNPKETEIMDLKCYCSIKEIGNPVELAVISVPAPKVNEVARECGKSGVKGLIVITSGFKEIGREGLKQEQELLAICRQFTGIKKQSRS